ncbi:MAG: hypothetical protein IJZ87_07070 [Bacteroidales bacterium]|nr:hypothetical protein [Bacteroidales bacterium]
MKKLVLILFVLFSVGLNAQTESHLEFKGIPITGNLSNMVSKLKTQNYELIETRSDGAQLKGQFANERCDIVVFTTPKSRTVYQVTVMFEENDMWHSLKSDYNNLKEQLSRKYNVKPDPIEIFLDPYYEGDGYELQALRKHKCFYTSNFDLTNGDIILAMYYDGRVVLIYTDAVGNDLKEIEENQNSYDDL